VEEKMPVNEVGDNQADAAAATASAAPAPQCPNSSAGQSGKYMCLRCCWRWSPRRGFPDPPERLCTLPLGLLEFASTERTSEPP